MISQSTRTTHSIFQKVTIFIFYNNPLGYKPTSIINFMSISAHILYKLLLCMTMDTCLKKNGTGICIYPDKSGPFFWGLKIQDQVIDEPPLWCLYQNNGKHPSQRIDE
jgi:hypothetical protein